MKLNSCSLTTLCIATTVASLASPSTSNALEKFFSDTVFNNAVWSQSVIFQAGPAASFSVQQISTGGNPDEYRQLQHIYGGAGSIITGHLNKTSIFDPTINRELTSIDVSFDLLLLDGGDSLSVAYGPLLFQNGSYYGASTVPTTTTPTINVWVHHDYSDLIASNFGRIAGPGSTNPDFSSTGDPILFGYYAFNTIASQSQTSTLSGLDNWSTILHFTPEPTTAILLLPGLVFSALNRRFQKR